MAFGISLVLHNLAERKCRCNGVRNSLHGVAPLARFGNFSLDKNSEPPSMWNGRCRLAHPTHSHQAQESSTETFSPQPAVEEV